MFEYTLLDRARAAGGTSCCRRGPTSGCCGRPTSLLRRRVVELTLLGPEAEVRGAASRLGLDLYGAHVLDPTDAGAASSASRPSTRRGARTRA